jgi:hypothetical protein
VSQQDIVEPIMEQYKPPGLIKKIYFRQFSFGTAPIRIDDVWIDKTEPDGVILEVMWQHRARPTVASEKRSHPSPMHPFPMPILSMYVCHQPVSRPIIGGCLVFRLSIPVPLVHPSIPVCLTVPPSGFLSVCLSINQSFACLQLHAVGTPGFFANCST